MHFIRLSLMSAALYSIGTASAGDTDVPPSFDEPPAEQVVWRGTPIRVDLRLKSERTVRLPGATTIRSGLLGGPVPGLRIQALGDHLYLLAEQPFASTRLLVQTDTGSVTDTGASILLDLAADKSFTAGAPLTVLTAVRASTPIDDTVPPTQPPAPSNPPIGYVALIRHAAQTLYAPTRLIPRADRIVRAPLRSREQVHLMRGAHIEALPIAAWRAEGAFGPLWLTAVKLRNRLDRPVVLDPRNLRGQWRAASFQHARLSSAGASTDTTTVYLIADRHFDQMLGPFAATAAASEPVSP